ncbi:RND efflux system, inner membrane transporter CmeB [Arcticibacter svalbardensis MN12-7]|uniref:RND efflux system, inner membrane transporter CmeB n=1 Tax=Arcticibacter svalbardensis MN12-7 TaxID=1150600 RepID=R9GLZ1_9SPHI|nr:multidrug efflux RND transporter permease subunit [Arcticibacter svalbardensis]EOR92733.1 RND efflux system, inner membrane transporter CmeB [Arcticibacter svalbardensis MN12-7]
MISEVFIRRPVTAIVISILIVLIGVIVLTTLPISQYPNIAPPTVTVSSTYTGADAETVEKTVTTPIESQINGTPGMSYMSSNSTSDGRSAITVTFDVGTDIDIATLDVQNRVGIAEPALPEAVRRLGVTTRKANTDILMVLGLYSPKGTHDVKFMSNYVNLYIRDAILRVPGVGDVQSFGQPFSMRIWLDAGKMAQLNLTPADVSTAIQEQNVRVPGGSVGGAPQQSSQAFEFSVILDGDLETEDQFKNIIIKTGADGSIVYLKDVARVELGEFSYAINAKVNGKAASMMAINQMPGGNAVQTAEGIYKTLEELKRSFPSDMDYTIGYETVSVINVSIEAVIHTLIEALVLVTLVVFLFLQSWRATLIPVLAIPVSIIGTFIFFTLLGFSINTLTMLAFVLAIGIVVDDAIVVVEAVQHYIDHEKLSAKEATSRAMKDITAPVIAIALILAAVFIPVGFIPGMVGQLYQQFSITIAVSVIISAFIALSLTPALCSLLLVPMNLNKESRGLNKFFYRFNRWFQHITGKYSNGVQWTIRKTPMALILLVCIFIGTVGLFRSKSAGFIPNEDAGVFLMGVSLPEGASAARTNAFIETIIGRIKKEIPEVKNITSIQGINILNRSFKSNAGTFFVQMKNWDEREKTVVEAIGQIQGMFAGSKEGSILAVSPPAIPGLGVSGGFSIQIEEQTAGSLKDFQAAAYKFLGAVSQRPEIAMAYTLFNANTPNYQLTVDREQAKKMGVSVGAIYSTISSYLGSSYINDFTRYGRNYRVVTQADTTYRQHIEDIGKLYVKNLAGNNVPLSGLVKYQIAQTATIINHYNLFRSIEVSGSAAAGYSSGDALDALEEVAAQTLPQGYSYSFSGLSAQEREAGSSTLLIFGLCIVFVFLLLAALYESWSVPFSILLSVPLGLFGAILALTFLPKIDNNIYAQIGLVTLIGLAAKNAILIVEFAKERVDWGMEVVAATIEAVKLRLRPIIMTSMAFILGIIPLMLSSGAGAIARTTIGWTVFGGMLAATLLAIFFVPVLFIFITRLAYGKKKLEELQANYNAEQHTDTLHVDEKDNEDGKI